MAARAAGMNCRRWSESEQKHDKVCNYANSSNGGHITKTAYPEGAAVAVSESVALIEYYYCSLGTIVKVADIIVIII